MYIVSKMIHLLLVDPASGPKWACEPISQPAEFEKLAKKIKAKFPRRGVALPFIGSCPLIVAPLIVGDTPEQCHERDRSEPEKPVQALGVWLDCKCVLAPFHAECIKCEQFRSATFPADTRIKLVTFVHAQCGECDKAPAAQLEGNGNLTNETRTEQEVAIGLLGRFACCIGTYDTSLFAARPGCPCREISDRGPEFGKEMHLEASLSFMEHLVNTKQLRCTAKEALNWVLAAREDSREYQLYSSYLTRQQSSELIRKSEYFIEKGTYVATRPFGTCATSKTVLDVVSSATGIAKERILGSSREGDIVFCRHLAAYIFRCTSRRSFKKIAELLNRDNHTTAQNSCLRIEEFMDEHPFHQAFVRMLVERADEIGILHGRAYRM